MNGKSIDTGTAWVDPEDAPELTDELLDRMMEKGVWHIGTREVSREEGMEAFRQAMSKSENILSQDSDLTEHSWEQMHQTRV